MRPLLLLLLSLLTSCSVQTTLSPQQDSVHSTPLEWSLTKATDVRGVFLLVHGLNARPHTLDPLINELNGLGFHTVLVSLAGHGPGESLQAATSEQWIADVAAGYHHAQERFPNLQVSGLGYSAGATALLRFLDLQTAPMLQRLIFFAPAFRLGCNSVPIRLISFLRHLGVSLPSLAPPSYRVHTRTALQAYHSLFRLVDDVRRLSHHKELGKIPTIIFAKPDDELVSVAKIERWLQENGLERWNLIPLDTRQNGKSYNHLVIDEDGAGPKNWETIRNELRRFIQNPNP